MKFSERLKARKRAKRTGIPFLGALPLDPQLSTLSDAGKIEDYQSANFDQITRNLAEEIAKSSDKNLA